MITTKYLTDETFSTQLFIEYQKKLEPEIDRIIAAQKKEYETEYASVYAPFDEDAIAHIIDVVQEKKDLNPLMLIIIGIGGSHLGTAAVHEALNGAFYNELGPECKLYFIDSVDTDRVHIIVQLMEQELQSGNNVLLNVISKSGTTTETIANFFVLYQILKKYKQDAASNYIIVTSDENSPLHEFAKKNNCTFLPVPKNVGGRFSVFTSVGLFPLEFVGIDIKELVRGARDAFLQCTDKDIEKNSAALSASLLHYHYQHGVYIHNMFIFWQDGQKLGYWYRQLLAESIAKEYDKDGKQVFMGITPTVSVGSTDLHSVAQLYLGGPKNMFTTFITIGEEQKVIVVPKDSEKINKEVAGKTLYEILSAIVTGTMIAYKKQELPYIECVLRQKNAYFIGMFLQCKMIEILYLGYLCNVNPFNQPHVELYKTQTKRLLTDE